MPIIPPDDSIGTGPIPESMGGPPAAKPKLTLGRASTVNEESRTEQELNNRVWLTSMVYESGILREAFEQGRVVLECQDGKDLHKTRMRLYRAKRLLLRQGNVYVGVLTFEVRQGRWLVITPAENMHKKKVTDEATLKALGLA